MPFLKHHTIALNAMKEINSMSHDKSHDFYMMFGERSHSHYNFKWLCKLFTRLGTHTYLPALPLLCLAAA